MSDKGDSRSRSKSLSRSRSGSRQGRYNSSDVEDRGRPEVLEKKTSQPRGTFDRSRSRSVSRHRSSRRRSRTRSRSRTPRRRRSSRYSRSRSPYYGGSGGGGGYGSYDDRERRYSGRNRSRSPMSRRRRHMGSREDPKESRCLGVFGLSMYTQEREIRDLFGRYGPIEDVQVVYDHQTGRSRGFAFVYMRNTEDAVEAKDLIAGMEVDGHKLRVDYSITERAHTPTPGIYLGRATSRGYRGGGGGGGGYSGGGGGGGRDYYSRRSPSPYYGRRRGYSRSRSRSYSPRRY